MQRVVFGVGFAFLLVTACTKDGGSGPSPDAPEAPNAPSDPCAECTPDQLCVQSFDGTCNLSTACVERTVECPENACSTDCEQAYCSAPYQCQNRPPCGTESANAFTCYGP